MATFRNVNFTVVRGKLYGVYYILSKYKGVDLKIPITDSDVWYFIDDESYPEKRMEALRYCYHAILKAYENRFCINF